MKKDDLFSIQKKVFSDAFIQLLNVILKDWDAVHETHKLPLLQIVARITTYVSQGQAQTLFPHFVHIYQVHHTIVTQIHVFLTNFLELFSFRSKQKREFFAL